MFPAELPEAAIESEAAGDEPELSPRSSGHTRGTVNVVKTRENRVESRYIRSRKF